MVDPKTPFEVAAQIQEDAYHRRRDEMLIQQLRDEMQRKKRTADLAEAVEVEDEALLGRLVELGISKETIPVLHLIPLLQVAWADGEVQEEERKLLMEAATATGLTDGPSFELFQSYLTAPPPAELANAAVDFIAHLIQVLPEEDGNAARSNLCDFSYRIADACGGVFGLWGRVEDEERAALSRIAERLETIQPGAAGSLLERL